MTKKEMFAEVIKMAKGEEVTATAEEIVAFAEKEIANLTKKAENKAPTARQKENDELRKVLISVLATADKELSIAEIKAKAPDTLGRLNGSQRLSALLTPMVKDGRVERTVVKKVPHFRMVATN